MKHSILSAMCPLMEDCMSWMGSNLILLIMDLLVRTGQKIFVRLLLIDWGLPLAASLTMTLGKTIYFITSVIYLSRVPRRVLG